MRAAKARIDRMCKPKTRRRDLEVPEWVRKEWSTGDKTKIASVLQEQNFDKAIEGKYESESKPQAPEILAAVSIYLITLKPPTSLGGKPK